MDVLAEGKLGPCFKLLGHSTMEMTMRHAHLAPDKLTVVTSVLDQSRFGHANPQE